MKVGQDHSSTDYWNAQSEAYADAIGNDYHTHRLSVFYRSIPRSLLEPGRRILDFGCGDGVIVPYFAERGVQVFGIDPNAELVDLAKERAGQAGASWDSMIVGGCEAMASFGDASFDAVVALNVLAYMSDDEERNFYEEAQRLLKNGGYLLVTHSNVLFDLFSLNRYTKRFFAEEFGCADRLNDIEPLLPSNSPAEMVTYNVRENPLAYRYKLAGYGFTEIDQQFINFHEVPPSCLPAFEKRTFRDTMSFADDERWRLIFQCSTFLSVAQK